MARLVVESGAIARGIAHQLLPGMSRHQQVGGGGGGGGGVVVFVVVVAYVMTKPIASFVSSRLNIGI